MQRKNLEAEGPDSISDSGRGYLMLEGTITDGLADATGRRVRMKADRQAVEFLLSSIASRPEWDEHLLALADLLRQQRADEELWQVKRTDAGYSFTDDDRSKLRTFGWMRSMVRQRFAKIMRSQDHALRGDQK